MRYKGGNFSGEWREGLLVWEVSGHALSPWRKMITHTSGGAAVPEGKSGLVPRSGIAVSEQSKCP